MLDIPGIFRRHWITVKEHDSMFSERLFDRKKQDGPQQILVSGGQQGFKFGFLQIQISKIRIYKTLFDF